MSEGFITAAVNFHESNASLSLTTKTRLFSQLTPSFFSLSTSPDQSLAFAVPPHITYNSTKYGWHFSKYSVPSPLEKSVTHILFLHSKL